MKSILFAALLLLSISVQSQVLYHIKDKLTGETWKETTWERFSHRTRGPHSVKSDFRIVKHSDTTIFFDLKMSVSGRELPIREGNKLAIYFKETPTPLIMTCIENSSATARSGSGDHFYPRYKITKEDLITLMNNSYDHLLLQTANQSYEDDNDGRVKNLIKNAASGIETGKLANGEPIVVRNKER